MEERYAKIGIFLNNLDPLNEKYMALNDDAVSANACYHAEKSQVDDADKCISKLELHPHSILNEM